MTEINPEPHHICISRSPCSLPIRTNGAIPDTDIETAAVRPVPLPDQLLPHPEPRITAAPTP
jgi:hypothetical protein